MTNIKNIILKIKNININSNQNKFKNYIDNFFNKWFIKLNNDDLGILIELSFFLIIRIKNLFNIKDQDLIFQFTKNNNQDIKAITLLFLPFLNDTDTNLYNKLTSLNEIILITKLKENLVEIDRNEALKEYFKYSTIAVGLLNKDGIEDELIYKIIYYKFLSINNTLSIINGKLYINWINITPLTLDNYKNSYIYKQTTEKINDFIYSYLNDKINNLQYNGLYVGEFYNVYRNIYYENIKKVKWLIFPYLLNNNKIYLLQYLNQYLNVDSILENNSFDDLNYKIQMEFINKLKSTNLNNIEYTIWKNIIIFMVNNYSHKLIIFNEFKDLEKVFTIDNLENETKSKDYNRASQKKIDEIKDSDISLFLKNINPKYLWDFIKESLIIFESTIYYKYLIKDNKILDNFYEFTKDNNRFNLKNLYNIAKSLVHKEVINNDGGKEWTLLSEKYESLLFNDKTLFWNKFNNTINSSTIKWLNLRNNLDIEAGVVLSFNDYNNKINEILTAFKEFKYDLVWEYLVTNGIINEFKVDYKLTDKTYSKKMENELRNKFKKNPEWKDAYYFINNKKYSDLKKIKIKKNDYEIEEKDYFDYLESKLKWYSFYAMDWISQINFYNHYLNHRVLLVTGATGQGKSTQVPKLLLYATKMLDYKTKGKIVCTQPRINVTVGNSEWIAQEMGIPIKNPHLKLGKIKTDNFFLQYKYSEDNHIKNLCSHLTLKLATDGSLFEELINNPMLKEQIYSKNKDTFIYGFKNIYDTIIIDESHEHNVYMDLLTTIIRSSIYFNNDVKFVIMSATLEEDEPIYRRYFRFINDNLLYPIVQEYLDPFTQNNTVLIDRIYLDRRFHISPPGESTQYQIVENYLSNSLIDKSNDDDFNSDLTLDKSFSIIQKICNETQKGDILLFANGRKDIMDAVKYLNQVLPEGNITLPYLSEIHERYKDIILNIEKTIGFIKNKRATIHDTWTSGDFIEENVQSGIYKRAIIVATNVAEASLTLPSLRYVVETGYTKTNIYDPDLDIYNFKIEPISEASRKQRKGRVGRTAEGTVYYIYEKGARESIKPKFKISQINYEDTFLKLMKKSEKSREEDGVVVPNLYDPNNYITFKKQLNNINLKSLSKFEIYKKNIIQILLKQYDLKNITYEKYWNNLYFKEIKIEQLDFFERYNTGFKMQNLLDLEGNFYLIHPYEAVIKRNILNEIIMYNDKKMKEIEDKNFFDIINKLNYKMILIDVEYKNIFNKNKKIIFSNYHVCEIYNFISEIRSKIKFVETDKEALVILASLGFDCLYEVLAILTLLKVSGNSIKNLLNIDKSYNNQDREFELLYEIFNNFKKKFYNFNIFKINSLDYLLKKYNSLFNKICNDFKNYYIKDNENIPKNFNVELWNLLIINYKNGKLSDSSCFQQILNINSILNDDIFNEYKIYNKEIIIWCQNNSIKSDIFIQFLNIYTKNIIDILTIQKNDDSRYTEPSVIEIMKKFSSSFLKTLETDTISEKIIKSFLFGFPFQFGFKINNTPNHITYGYHRIVNTDTKINNSPYIFYYSLSQSKNDTSLNVAITNKIKIEWLPSILPLYYNTNNFKTLYLLYDNQDKIILKEINNSNYESLCVKIANSWSRNSILFDNVDSNYPILYSYIKLMKKSF